MKYPIEVNETRKINRITIKQSFLDLMNAFNLERGLIFTIKLLFISPSKIVKLYLNEGRFKIVNAFRLLILTTAASLFILYLADVDDLLVPSDKEFLEGFANEEQVGADYLTGMMKQIYFDWYNLFLWIAIPIYGFFTYLLYRKNRYNFAEHMVIQSFHISGLNVIMGLILPMHYLFGQEATMYIGFALATLYFFYFIIGVFSKTSFKAIVRTLLLYLLSNAVYFIILGFILLFMINYNLSAASG